ncbi:NUDIX hydrolase [candidate division WWE3 bacterium]|nr:NUDIX hydrolase [candidate division WWE3 bacterium]
MIITPPPSQQPLPPQAKKVFSGIMFDVYQWEQPQFDGSIKVFEKIKRPDTVVVFPVMADGKIMLTRQRQPGKQEYIAGVGGRVDAGEDILQAVKRELLEETGYSADTFTLWNAQQPFSKIEWSVYTFIAKNLTKIAEPTLDPGEDITIMPVSFDEFITIATQPDFSEKEIVPLLYEARLNESAYASLKQLFAPA